MSNFDLEEYRTFVRSKMIGKASYHKVDITEKLLEALFQFEVAPSIYIKDISSAEISRKYKNIFDLYNKKPGIFMNTWFLYKFNYKYCSSCKKVESIKDYGVDNSRSDKLNVYCISCFSKINNKWYESNKEAKKEDSKNYYKNNIEIAAERNKKYYENNIERIAERNKKYKAVNLDKYNALNAKRRATKLRATPKWLSKEQHKQILEFYTEAKRLEQETGIKYHVDHIVPLQGITISGLHVPWNLQILTAKENMSKGNRINGL
jgi:hypothetical protein